MGSLNNYHRKYRFGKLEEKEETATSHDFWLIR